MFTAILTGGQTPVLKFGNFLYEKFNDYLSNFVPEGASLDLNPIDTTIDAYMSVVEGVNNIKEFAYSLFNTFANLPPLLNSLIGVGFAVLIGGIIVSIVLRII